MARVQRCTREDDQSVLGLKFLQSGKAQHEALEQVRTHLRNRHGERLRAGPD
jgi:hypothetical protein